MFYEDVFKVAEPKLVEDFQAIRVLTLKGPDESIAVLIVMPTAKLPAIKAFNDQSKKTKNPLWAQGREAGWLKGTFTQEYYTPALFRGEQNGPPPPNLKGKGFTFNVRLPPVCRENGPGWLTREVERSLAFKPPPMRPGDATHRAMLHSASAGAPHTLLTLSHCVEAGLQHSLR